MSASFTLPFDLVVASDGSIYVLDSNNYAKNIRKLSNSGSGWTVSTVNAGNQGASCNFYIMSITYPVGLAIGSADELYCACPIL